MNKYIIQNLDKAIFWITMGAGVVNNIKHESTKNILQKRRNP